jgi:hypothetical protein
MEVFDGIFFDEIRCPNKLDIGEIHSIGLENLDKILANTFNFIQIRFHLVVSHLKVISNIPSHHVLSNEDPATWFKSVVSVESETFVLIFFK